MLCGMLVFGPGSPLHVNPIDGYQDGSLFLDQRLDGEAGSKLKERYIPGLRFTPDSEPVIASSVDVVDWKLCFNDVACHWSLLQHSRSTTPCAYTSSMSCMSQVQHVTLLVIVGHLVWTISEQTSSSTCCPYKSMCKTPRPRPQHPNHSIIVSEPALLLPYTDIKLTFFEFVAYNIVRQAKK